MQTDQSEHTFSGSSLLINQKEIIGKIEQAAKAYRYWKVEEVEQRQKCFFALSDYLKANKLSLAAVIVAETNKPIEEAVAEVEKCANCAHYYGTHLLEWFKPKSIPETSAYVEYQPLGLILGVMPFNYPFWQVIRSAVPILAAGNGYLLKHAPSTQKSAIALEVAFAKSGFPIHLFTNLNVELEELEGIVANRAVAGVTVTGSTKAGSAMAALAGKYLKPSVLELGGSDPFIVLDWEEPQKIVEAAAKARLVNAGQSCIAGKRFIVLEQYYQAFIDLLLDHLKELKASGYVPKLASAYRAVQLRAQIEEAIDHGAVSFPEIVETDGAIFSPIVLTNILPTNPIYSQELFGPIFMVFSAKDEDEAIQIANDSDYGLGASVWTSDITQFKRVALQLEYGMVVQNQVVVSDQRLPFGGVKNSGYGRELAEDGFFAFTNKKLIRLG